MCGCWGPSGRRCTGTRSGSWRSTAAGGGAPEITVLGNGVSITDGDTTPSTAMIRTSALWRRAVPPVSRTFTVRNGGQRYADAGGGDGSGGLHADEGLSGQSGAGASDTFTVQLDTATAGDKSGDVSFATNDRDESPVQLPDHGDRRGGGGCRRSRCWATGSRSRMGIRRPVRPTTRTSARWSRAARRSVGRSRFATTATATLTLGAVTVPAGFTLTEGLSGSLAPGRRIRSRCGWIPRRRDQERRYLLQQQ